MTGSGMLDRAAVAASLRGFEDPADGEACKSRELTLLLLERTPEPFSRHQFTPGHVTASGMVLAPDGERILLVHHRRLDRWLLPGGHVEPEDAAVAESARREVIEETGAMLDPRFPPRLLGIDVHGIPPKGAEPYHLHHDVLFGFRATSDHCMASEESRAVLWCSPGEFEYYSIPLNIRRAYGRLLTS
jgi:8-oxo-dGTP pyrophosphatase MutT (NUDIX family)